VSLILDALRRKSADHHSDDEEERPPARSVLSMLGYSSRAPARRIRDLLQRLVSGPLLRLWGESGFYMVEFEAVVHLAADDIRRDVHGRRLRRPDQPLTPGVRRRLRQRGS